MTDPHLEAILNIAQSGAYALAAKHRKQFAAEEHGTSLYELAKLKSYHAERVVTQVEAALVSLASLDEAEEGMMLDIH